MLFNSKIRISAVSSKKLPDQTFNIYTYELNVDIVSWHGFPFACLGLFVGMWNCVAWKQDLINFWRRCRLGCLEPAVVDWPCGPHCLWPDRQRNSDDGDGLKSINCGYSTFDTVPEQVGWVQIYLQAARCVSWNLIDPLASVCQYTTWTLMDHHWHNTVHLYPSLLK